MDEYSDERLEEMMVSWMQFGFVYVNRGGRIMKKVIAWRLTVWDENDKEYIMVDIPNHIAQDVDEWLSEMEEE